MPKSFGSSFFLSSILTFSYTVSLQSVMQQQCINLNSAFYSCLSSCESSSSNFWANHATCSRRWEHCWSGWRSADSTPVRLALCLGSWASGTGGNYKWCCHPYICRSRNCNLQSMPLWGATLLRFHRNSVLSNSLLFSRCPPAAACSISRAACRWAFRARRGAAPPPARSRGTRGNTTKGSTRTRSRGRAGQGTRTWSSRRRACSSYSSGTCRRNRCRSLWVPGRGATWTRRGASGCSSRRRFPCPRRCRLDTRGSIRPGGCRRPRTRASGTRSPRTWRRPWSTCTWSTGWRARASWCRPRRCSCLHRCTCRRPAWAAPRPCRSGSSS